MGKVNTSDMGITKKQAYTQAANETEKRILDVLFSYGAIITNRQRLDAAQKISQQFCKEQNNDPIPYYIGYEWNLK
jgi:hypothetical protein